MSFDLGQAASDSEAGTATAPRRVLCSACDHRLGDGDAAIAVDGSHAHTFANPSGLVFEVLCYAAMPGAAALGEPTAWFSWFPGAAWQVALCSACNTHVGWRFTGRDAPFFALIRDRVREA